jgi:hypothetical protein
MRQKNSAARDEISVLYVAHMAALLHPVKGKRPNCEAVRSNTLLECMEKITEFWEREMVGLNQRKRPDSFFHRVAEMLPRSVTGDIITG